MMHDIRIACIDYLGNDSDIPHGCMDDPFLVPEFGLKQGPGLNLCIDCVLPSRNRACIHVYDYPEKWAGEL